MKKSNNMGLARYLPFRSQSYKTLGKHARDRRSFSAKVRDVILLTNGHIATCASDGVNRDVYSMRTTLSTDNVSASPKQEIK